MASGGSFEMLGKSRYRVPLAVLILVLLLVTMAAVGCTAILGDFDVTTDAGHEVKQEAGAPDVSKLETSTTDTLTRADTGRDSSKPDALSEAEAGDTGTDVAGETSLPEAAATPEILTVKFAGAGTGKVTSSPVGVNCAVSCFATFDAGTEVTLTASTPAGSVFTGWSGGGCSGFNTCQVDMTAATTVTATFSVAATWDPTWSLAGVTYTDGNLSIVSSTAAETVNVRTTIGVSAGKWYWEVTATNGDGVDDGGLGIVGANMPNNAEWIGDVASGLGFGYGSAGFYCTWATTIPGCTNNGEATLSTTEPAPPAVTTGVVYMFALDMDTGFLWLGWNGKWNGTDVSLTAANYVASGVTGTVYAGVTLYDTVLAFTGNFGSSPFKYTVPTGYNPGLY
jgi:hypothetical protein